MSHATPSSTCEDFAAAPGSLRRLFGKVDAGYREQPVGEHKEQPKRGVMLVSNIRKDGKPIGALPDEEMHFHSDGQHRNIPIRATTPYAIKVPSRGGYTLFAAMHAAWEALSESRKRSEIALISRLMTQRNLELEPAESEAVLEQLFAHCERPEFVYAHRWTPGDLVI